MSSLIGQDIVLAGSLLRTGHLVAIPTETVYGLAANALSDDAVLKIYAAKERPRFNPLIMHVASLQHAENFAADLSQPLRMLAEAFWPGSLTLLLPKKKWVSDLLTAGSQKVAIRVPDHPLTLALLQQLQLPLAAPSANPSGYVSPTTAEHVQQQLGGKIDYILDGGTCTIGLESTIVGENNEGALTVFRTGYVTPEMIREVTGITPVLKTNATVDVDAPGQLKSHYATKTPLYLMNSQASHTEGDVLHISFGPEAAMHNYAEHWILAPDEQLATAAKNLFAMLRLADTKGFGAIVVESVPDEGLGLAINDRLRRAQHLLKMP